MKRAALFFVCLAYSFVAPAVAQTSDDGDAAQIALVEMAPYVERDANGDWHGPAVDLIRAAAERSGTEYRLTPANGASAALPVYAGSGVPDGTVRSLPLHTDAIGLIGGDDNARAAGFVTGLAGLFNWGFLKVVGAICLLLLVAGTLFWLVERSRNDGIGPGEGHRGRRLRGIGDGFWWAGVTATTIGYGDVVPSTTRGRIVALVWMLFSMALTALLTAYLVSLTQGPAAGGGGQSLADAVSGERVGIVAGGPVARGDLSGADSIGEFPDLDAALAAFDAGQIDRIAFPYQPAKAAAGDRGVARIADTIALPVVHVPDNAALRAEIDAIILSPHWQQRMNREFSR